MLHLLWYEHLLLCGQVLTTGVHTEPNTKVSKGPMIQELLPFSLPSPHQRPTLTVIHELQCHASVLQTNRMMVKAH
jgi:hypothetical protein